MHSIVLQQSEVTSGVGEVLQTPPAGSLLLQKT